LSPAYTFLDTVSNTAPEFSFAQHALLAQSKLSMASVCSDACAADRNAVQLHMTENGNDAMCSAPQLQPLVTCIQNLDSQIRVYCLQSKFWNHYQADCSVEGTSRRLHHSQAQVRQLADGTHSLDLGSLDQQTMMALSGAISASQKAAPLGNLKGYRLIYNGSDIATPTQNTLLSSWDTSAESSARSLVSRRLGFKDCSKRGNYCMQFNFPKPGGWRCSSVCNTANMPANKCKSEILHHCKLSFKITVAPPSRRSSAWTLTLYLGGSVNLLEVMFGMFSPPSIFFGNCNMEGGITFSSKAACPDIPFSLHGYAKITFAAGINFWLVGGKRTLFSLSLTVGAKIVSGSRCWRTRTDRRRGWDWRRRRRASWSSPCRGSYCDVEIYVRIEMVWWIVKGWMLLQYFLFRKHIEITLGLEVWVLFVGWVDIFEQLVVNTRIR